MCPKIPPKGVFIAGKARTSGFAANRDAKVSELIKRSRVL